MRPSSPENLHLPSDRDLNPGDVLGRYQLLAGVGQGGMGRVWAARQVGSSLERLVAVKTALGGQGQTREFKKLFMDEARIASMIHHPHVCGVHELGEHEGTWYLVMEWCDGVSLREVMDGAPQGKIDLPVASRIVANVAAGLHAAHELEDSEGRKLDVVHRDVSPQNILISKNGHVKVTDFGVARARGQLHRPTETGEMKGKLAYMAPEQVTAKDVDRRADVFALGCVLYEMTLGQRPFQGDGALSTLYQLLENKVKSPLELDPDYPEELSVAVLKALAQNVDDRFDTAEQLRVALESWLATCEQPGTSRDVAALLVETTGATVREKSNKVRSAIKSLSEPRPSAAFPSAAPNSLLPSSEGKRQGRTGASTVDRGLSAGRLPDNNSSWFLPLGAAAAVLAVVVVLAKGSLGGGSSDYQSSERSSAVRSPTALAVAAPIAVQAAEPKPVVENIRIRVRTEPPGGQLRLDDGPPVKAPFVVETAPDGTSHFFRASIVGRVEQTRTVVYDQDHEVVISLAPVPVKVKKAVKRWRRRRPVPVAQAKPAVPAQSAAASSPAASIVEGKRKRGLDLENPFGQ